VLERIRTFFTRLFRGKPPTPGRFVMGSKLSWSGWLATSPWVWPTREYLVYIPQGFTRWKRRPLLVLLHGCRQTPEDFAIGTRIAALADRNGWLVLLPRQTVKCNPWSCWNWFDKRTVAGGGEAAIVAAQVRLVRRAFRAHPRRVFAAGMSAGGALAAALGVQHSDMFAGIFAHSGLACGAAASPHTALDVMARGADGPYKEIALAASARNAGRIVPLLAIHGERDEVVAQINALQLVQQYLLLNGRLDPAAAASPDLPPPDEQRSLEQDGVRVASTSEYRLGNRSVVQRVSVHDLGHAWSGGDASLPYNDPHPPDASALLAEFIIAEIRAQRRPGFRRP
jgi:poly(hydroxyalkanoate) depolymerase family esterase